MKMEWMRAGDSTPACWACFMIFDNHAEVLAVIGANERFDGQMTLTAAVSFAVEAIAAPVRDRSELESVVSAQAREPNGGLIVMPDSFTDLHRAEIASLAARYRLPAVYPRRI